MSDETLRRYLAAAAARREESEARRLLAEAEDCRTVGEATKIAREAQQHLAKLEAYQDVQKLVGLPEEAGADE